jgi:ribonuclease HII
MPWIIGIDEAGYGPNLGPFVMTAVACRVPQALAGADLWQVLQEAVRRHRTPEDGRLWVEDSKRVYSPDRGLLPLETGVLATLCRWPDERPFPVSEYLTRFCPTAALDLASEPWYHGETLLPFLGSPAELAAAAARFERCCSRGQVVWGPVRSVVVCPTRFNGLLDQKGTKAAVLGYGLAELLRDSRDLDGGAEPLSFVIDKHGGRNTYVALLQDALADGMVVAQEEGPARSVYRVLGLERAVHLTFQPRADQEHFCVALASMASKYLREVFMVQFNRFWQQQVPSLKPTAGYPGDAARFFASIRSAAERLGISEAALWRRK